MYDVYCLQKTNHIDEIEQQLHNAQGFDKVNCHVMLAMQYSNLGDRTKADTHRDSKAIDRTRRLKQTSEYRPNNVYFGIPRAYTSTCGRSEFCTQRCKDERL